MDIDIGLCFHRTERAAAVGARARQAEELGFDEFWVIEDCFYTAGVSLAAAALTATEEIVVGIGILPVVARNAAITAMEFATLAGLGPGRFHAGLGHGVQHWMAQMHEQVDSPLTALRETFDAVRSLLDGAEVSAAGRYVSLDAVQLDQPPDPRPLLSAGIRGPKSMAVAAECADGVILADFVSADYLRWVRAQLGDRGHRITVFAELGVATGELLDDVKAGCGGHLASVCADPPLSLRMAPFWDELDAQASTVGWDNAIAAMPADWWSAIAGVGTPDDLASYVESLAEAGVDAVCFFPSPFDPIDDVADTAAALMAAAGR